ncbi:MAG: hypothetical protein IPM24_16685 [Bryobacterales bacterium]|nr:hypothetical protein [Bryobacterales bacterium]
MPRKREWLQHLPDAIATLEASRDPVADRRTVERLLRVGRRQAVRLLHGFGGYQAGRTFLIERGHLIRQLRRAAESEDAEREGRRREQLSERLEAVRRQTVARRVVIQPPAPPAGDGLPPGIHLGAGQLHIEYSSCEQLLERLLGLAQAIGQDFESFRIRVDTLSPLRVRDSG